MLELLKAILGIDNDDLDDVLDFYLEKSMNSIKNYLNIDMDEDDQDTYSNQIVDLAYFFYTNKNLLGIKQSTQGARSKSIELGIPQHIKESLPKPNVVVIEYVSE